MNSYYENEDVMEHEDFLENKYLLYKECADDGNGNDIATSEPLKTFDEWLES